MIDPKNRKMLEAMALSLRHSAVLQETNAPSVAGTLREQQTTPLFENPDAELAEIGRQYILGLRTFEKILLEAAANGRELKARVEELLAKAALEEPAK